MRFASGLSSTPATPTRTARSPLPSGASASGERVSIVCTCQPQAYRHSAACVLFFWAHAVVATFVSSAHFAVLNGHRKALKTLSPINPAYAVLCLKGEQI